MEYGIGGNDVKVNASESIAAIPENRTLIVEQLTSEEPINPEVVQGLTKIEDVFNHYNPHSAIEFENAEGQSVKETLHFKSVADFSAKSMTEQSGFLSEVSTENEFWENVQKQLRSNKILQRAMENPETKEAFIQALQGIAAELEQATRDY